MGADIDFADHDGGVKELRLHRSLGSLEADIEAKTATIECRLTVAPRM